MCTLLPIAWGTVATIVAIGAALGMDAFSLGIGLGAQGLRWRDVVRLSLVIGLFHVIFPLCSIWLGDVLHSLYGEFFQRLSALILMFLGAKMTVEAMQRNMRFTTPPPAAHLLQLIAFATTVSLDSLSVGFSLGTMNVNPLWASLIFGSISATLSALGLFVGRTFNQVLGTYAEIAGGIVLIILGMMFFW